MPADVIDKAVILAAGLGSRMRRADPAAQLDSAQVRAADSGIKALIPVAGSRPFLDYVLHELAEAGYRRICLVIGPDHSSVRDYYSRDVNARRLTFVFAVQPKPLGTANALSAAEDFASGDSFLLINSDNLYPAAACAALRELDGPGTALFQSASIHRGGNLGPDAAKKVAVGVVSSDGYLQRIIEKPDDAMLKAMGVDVYLSMNCWRFSSRIFQACRMIQPSVRGEYEIPAAVQYAIDHFGEKFRVLRRREPVLDLSSRADVAAVGALLAGRGVQL